MIKSSSSMLPSVESGSRETSFVIPNDILELLGPPPLIGTEDPSHYRALLTRFAVEFEPKTITEWFLVFDLVNVNWEILRYRRVRTTLIRLACRDALALIDKDNNRSRAWNWHLKTQMACGIAVSRKSRSMGPTALRRELAEAGLTVEDVYDSVLIKKLDQIERFDKLIERLENLPINRYLAEHNQQPKPFTWTADPDKIIAAVKRGHQVLDSIH